MLKAGIINKLIFIMSREKGEADMIMIDSEVNK